MINRMNGARSDPWRENPLPRGGTDLMTRQRGIITQSLPVLIRDVTGAVAVAWSDGRVAPQT